ncbi:hypothetical protein [Streptomyces sp. NPDC060194]|uniref:hypothetical protein n=1 Tax=Streptomyces sp. NPDC060194 TaxID=3347069 RepID=UPI003646C206
MTAAPPPKLVTRLREGRIHAYAVGDGDHGPLEPVATFAPRHGDEAVDAAVGRDLESVVYTTLNDVVCLTAAGDVRWASALEPRSDVRHGHRPGCALSADGRAVWVYRPDAMAGRGTADRWVVLDAQSGLPLGERKLETVGHGGEHHVHPADGSVYLDIGEGQDGSVVLRGTLGADGEPEFTAYPWSDRILIQLSPDGTQFMTVDHDQADVSFHRHPDGDVLTTLPVEAFGYDPEDHWLEWSGGYLTAGTAVVTVRREDDEEEWFRHHLVDLRTGTPGGEPATSASHPYDLVPLGDGTWLTGMSDGRPVRTAGAFVPDTDTAGAPEPTGGRPEPLLPLLAADTDGVAFFAGTADLDATDPASHLLEVGVRLASGARLEQFARAGSGDAYCFVGEGGEDRPVVLVSLDGEAGLLAVGLPELVRLLLAVPWWRDAPGRSSERLRDMADEYRRDQPDLDDRRDRAARAIGLDPAALPSEAAALARLAELTAGPVAAACRVVGHDGEPLEPLFRF